MTATEQQFLTPLDLNTNADLYDGRPVVVRGFVVIGPEARALYQSEDRCRLLVRLYSDPEIAFDPRDYLDECLTLLNADLLNDNRAVFAGQTITVEGVFDKDYLDGTVIDLQACGNPTALVLDEKDVQRIFQELRQ